MITKTKCGRDCKGERKRKQTQAFKRRRLVGGECRSPEKLVFFEFAQKNPPIKFLTLLLSSIQINLLYGLHFF